MVALRLTWPAPRAEYGLITEATAGAAATLPSMAVISARTAVVRTVPWLARQTIVSWSPACPGNAFSSRLSALVEPVPGRVRASEYADPAARPPTVTITSSISHPASTHLRCWKHQRAIEAMSVPLSSDAVVFL